ncbi:MAG: chemotaxis protein CheD [Spirochaetia bacterium]|nr:chemotaxis protein CheD [Spirochaetia bacterium]
MLKHAHDRTIVNVAISDVKFVSKNELLKTTLGSCVSVVIYPKSKKTESTYSSMSHFLLPTPSHSSDKERHPFRFGDYLINHQIDKMLQKGFDIRELQAKVAGGATMFPLRKKSQIYDIGNANAEVALKVLKERGLSVLSQNTGGEQGRSIMFDPLTKMLRIHIFGDKEITI